MKAKLLVREKFTDQDGDLTELVVWKLQPSRLYREGIRYRFAFVPRGHRGPAILYDNHHPKGPHRHLDDLELPYLFVGVDRAIIDFKTDVALWKRRRIQ